VSRWVADDPEAAVDNWLVGSAGLEGGAAAVNGGLKKLGRRLRSIRQTAGYDAPLDLADATNRDVSESTITNYEHGEFPVTRSGRAFRAYAKALRIDWRREIEVVGDSEPGFIDALRVSRNKWLLELDKPRGAAMSVRDYVKHLTDLSDEELLQQHPKERTFRLVLVDALEQRWNTYEAFFTDKPSIRSRDDRALEELAEVWSELDGLVSTDILEFLKDYQTRLRTNAHGRTKMQVVMVAQGLRKYLAGLGSGKRAEFVVTRMIETASADWTSVRTVVLEQGFVNLAQPTLEVTAREELDLATPIFIGSQPMSAVAISHRRAAPDDYTHLYDVWAQGLPGDRLEVAHRFGEIATFWHRTLGQYSVEIGDAAFDPETDAVLEHTVKRLQECLASVIA
jgi:transcriptional regulator with XRE-family HTH domain